MVVLILLLLSTIAVGVYIRELARARYATAKSTITEMERACARYQIDLGVYPPATNAFILNETLETLPLRMRQHSDSAAKVAATTCGETSDNSSGRW